MEADIYRHDRSYINLVKINLIIWGHIVVLIYIIILVYRDIDI